MSDEIQKRGGSRNPFNTYDASFQQVTQKPDEVFSASSVASKEDQKNQHNISGIRPAPVSLPPHLFIPADAQSVDIRNLANVPPATTVELLRFECPKGMFVKFINYSVFFDALLFNLVNLVPKINGVRILPFHGNPQQKYKIGLGTGPDLSNANLIACQIDMQPNDVLVWEFTNSDVVDVAAGVRMVGYVDQSTIRKMGRFGG